MGATLIGGFWIPLRLAFPAVIQSPWADILIDQSILVLLLIPLLHTASEFRRTRRGILWLLALGLAALPLVSRAESSLGNTATLLYLAKLPLLCGFREVWKLRQRLDALHPVAARFGRRNAAADDPFIRLRLDWAGQWFRRTP